MSDTPETDAARLCGYGYFSGALVPVERKCYEKDPDGDVVFYEVAEKLERERDDALKEWDIAREGWSKALEERDEARRELVEARRMAPVWENIASIWEKVALREASINGEEKA